MTGAGSRGGTRGKPGRSTAGSEGRDGRRGGGGGSRCNGALRSASTGIGGGVCNAGKLVCDARMFTGGGSGGGSDLRGSGGGNLAGADFGGVADALGADFGEVADAPGVDFGGVADAPGVDFGGVADLAGADFGGAADLAGADFGGVTEAPGVDFGGVGRCVWTAFGVDVGVASVLSLSRNRSSVSAAFRDSETSRPTSELSVSSQGTTESDCGCRIQPLGGVDSLLSSCSSICLIRGLMK
ncbi:MAG: hypothetical protein HOW73_24700 [Polyangiaceae bacterium]|nr:hypothetical protein [Polyangiaceae bacterium]